MMPMREQDLRPRRKAGCLPDPDGSRTRIPLGFGDLLVPRISSELPGPALGDHGEVDPFAGEIDLADDSAVAAAT